MRLVFELFGRWGWNAQKYSLELLEWTRDDDGKKTAVKSEVSGGREFLLLFRNVMLMCYLQSYLDYQHTLPILLYSDVCMINSMTRSVSTSWTGTCTVPCVECTIIVPIPYMKYTIPTEVSPIFEF